MIPKQSVLVCCLALFLFLSFGCGQSGRLGTTLSRPVALDLLREEARTLKPVTYDLPLFAILHDVGAIREQNELAPLALLDAMASSGILQKTKTDPSRGDAYGGSTLHYYELADSSCKDGATSNRRGVIAIVIATIELADVTGIVQEQGAHLAMVDFVLRTTPTDCHKKISKLIGSNVNVFSAWSPWPTRFADTKGRVIFTRYDDGWRAGKRSPIM